MDTNELYEALKSGDYVNVVQTLREDAKHAYFLNTCGKPLITFVNGLASGSGLAISAWSDYNFTTESAIVHFPETSMGWVPSVGHSYLLARLDRQFAGLGTYLGLTGKALKANDLVHARIAAHYSLTTMQYDIMERMSSNFSLTREMLDLVIREVSDESEEPFSLAPVLHVIERCFGPTVQSVEQLMEALRVEETKTEEYANTHIWAREIREILQDMSPTALKVAFRAIRNPMAELGGAYSQDFRVALRMLTKCPDFCEANRCMKEEVSEPPRWNPATLEEVTDEYVDSFFRPLTYAEDKTCELIFPEAVHLEDAIMRQMRRNIRESPDCVEIIE